MAGGASTRAQQAFPEGYFFLYALYGLTYVDLAVPSSPREARWAHAKLENDEGREPFSATLDPSYGVFYRGWTNWLRGGILMLQPASSRDPVEVRRFEADSAALGAAFDASATPFLAAYPGQAWPVDSVEAMASLALQDKLLPPRFATTVIRWTANERADSGPRTGLIPHTADIDTGDPTSGARGSSQSLTLRFLGEIDPAGGGAGELRRGGRAAGGHAVEPALRLRGSADRRRFWVGAWSKYGVIGPKCS